MIIQGDCLKVLDAYLDNTFSGIVTDPPYGLNFMGKKWDSVIPGEKYWTEFLRVCKPGAMMLCFGGTRTYHRLACYIEDAGWEIRDCLMWIYGSGFPKSHNNFGLEGYGTALKPAYEPIILAMKPVDGTYAQNVEKWGIGGLNIDVSRIDAPDQSKLEKNWNRENITDIRSGNFGNGISSGIKLTTKAKNGRWPANILFDEKTSKMLDEQSGNLKSGKLNPIDSKKSNAVYGKYNKANINSFSANSGGASRFFYCAKACPNERKENNHPTVKPIKLLEYLLKLIAPPKDALILDPFAGSGSIIVAAKRLGIDSVGIEIDEEYCKIANARIENVGDK